MKTFLFILALITTASAEPVTITLKSGGTMTGLLVGKSDAEIKVETDYGIIPLRVDAVTPESWTSAHRATPSKPTGKYIVPNRSPEKPQPGKKIVKGPSAYSVAAIRKAYATNPVAADLKFEGKRIAVTGVISGIGTDILGSPFVTLVEKVIKIYERGSEKQIARLKIGQTTTLSGDCHGMSLGLLLIRNRHSATPQSPLGFPGGDFFIRSTQIHVDHFWNQKKSQMSGDTPRSNTKNNMSETPTPLPPSKPDTTTQPTKAPAKPPKPVVSKSAVALPTIKSSPINPAWAAEVAKAYGLAGPLAEAVAEHLSNAIAEHLDKVTQPEKLTRLVKEAAVECIGKVG